MCALYLRQRFDLYLIIRIKKREIKIPKPNLELVIFPKTLKFKINFKISNFHFIFKIKNEKMKNEKWKKTKITVHFRQLWHWKSLSGRTRKKEENQIFFAVLMQFSFVTKMLTGVKIMEAVIGVDMNSQLSRCSTARGSSTGFSWVSLVSKLRQIGVLTLLCILNSFWVLHTHKSWSKHLILRHLPIKRYKLWKSFSWVLKRGLMCAC